MPSFLFFSPLAQNILSHADTHTAAHTHYTAGPPMIRNGWGHDGSLTRERDRPMVPKKL